MRSNLRWRVGGPDTGNEVKLRGRHPHGYYTSYEPGPLLGGNVAIHQCEPEDLQLCRDANRRWFLAREADALAAILSGLRQVDIVVIAIDVLAGHLPSGFDHDAQRATIFQVFDHQVNDMPSGPVIDLNDRLRLRLMARYFDLEHQTE